MPNRVARSTDEFDQNVFDLNVTDDELDTIIKKRTALANATNPDGFRVLFNNKVVFIHVFDAPDTMGTNASRRFTMFFTYNEFELFSVGLKV